MLHYDRNTNLAAGCPSGHANEERLPIIALISGLVTWLCLAVACHASSAARCGPLTHGGACAPRALLPFDDGVGDDEIGVG